MADSEEQGACGQRLAVKKVLLIVCPSEKVVASNDLAANGKSTRKTNVQGSLVF